MKGFTFKMPTTAQGMMEQLVKWAQGLSEKEKRDTRSVAGAGEVAEGKLMDVVVELLKRAGVPVTRESYLRLAYFGRVPKELSAEEEAELPKELQDWTRGRNRPD